MFLKRLITGLILSATTILAIYFLSLPIYVGVVTIFMLLVSLEWGVLMGSEKFWVRISYVILMGLLMYESAYLPILPILLVAFVFWLLIFLAIIFYPKGSAIWGKGSWIRGLMGVFAIIPTWVALNHLRTLLTGPSLIIFMLLVIWSVDTGAYAFGKLFGKHKMLPSVSPNKTLEGLLGAFVLPLIVSMIACLVLGVPMARWLPILGLTIFTAVFAIIGDLLESMLKRQIGVKDLGHYLPGHGGLLDRVDSLLAAAPMFLLALMLLNGMV